MKNLLLIMAIALCLSCHHRSEEWPAHGDKQAIALYVRNKSLSDITSPPASYQVFVYDKQQRQTHRYDLAPAKYDNPQLQIKLFPGEYTGYCVTNAGGDSYWEYDPNKNPEEIYLKAQKSKSGNEEAGDHLLGQTDFTVTEDNNNTTIFNLSRKIGMLKISIENIPAWLTDLQINLSNVPQKMSLTGEYEGSYTVSKPVTLPDEEGFSETTLLVFPSQKELTLSLSSESMVFITPEHPISAIRENQKTHIKATFPDIAELPSLDINFQPTEWDENIIEEEDWQLPAPLGPCTGEGDGNNLVANAGFEESFTNNLPNEWKFESSGKSKNTTEINFPTYSGNKAVCLKGKTYLYQDINISGGQCYQFKAYANAPSNNVKWKYWYTWINGSQLLNKMSSAIRIPTNQYKYQTEGYIEAFEGAIFRAPTEATKLRVEFRTYMNDDIEEGLYLDAVSVEKVN